MTKFRISGVWKNSNNVITAYSFHTVEETGTSRAKKTPKTEAIALLEKAGNTATTWMWNYLEGRWKVGENVTVVNGSTGKFLRSNPDNKLTDNLAHLIDFDWIVP